MGVSPTGHPHTRVMLMLLPLVTRSAKKLEDSRLLKAAGLTASFGLRTLQVRWSEGR